MGNIIAIGELVVEIMADKLDQPLDKQGLWHGPYPSGAPAIMAAQAAQSGAASIIIGTVGNDDFGRNILERLGTLNIKGARIDDEYTTGIAFVRYNNNGSRDFIYHIPHAAAGQIKPEQVKEEYFKKGGFLHITGSSLGVPSVRNAVETALDYCKKYNVKVSFDPNIRKELSAHGDQYQLIQKILSQTYILLPSEGELEVLTGLKDEEASIKEILNNGIEIIVLKKGAKGAVLITKDTHICAKACSVNEVDPTGAGDVFAGMLLSSLLQKMSYKEALQYATAAGTYSVTQKGPMEGISNYDELSYFLPQM
ncbi:MAG: carbohydrate kinase family protein [Alphaproteobacteria bacterium]